MVIFHAPGVPWVASWLPGSCPVCCRQPRRPAKGVARNGARAVAKTGERWESGDISRMIMDDYGWKIIYTHNHTYISSKDIWWDGFRWWRKWKWSVSFLSFGCIWTSRIWKMRWRATRDDHLKRQPWHEVWYGTLWWTHIAMENHYF